MSTTKAPSTLPALPPNVQIFSPTNPLASQTLLQSRIFTKLAATASTTPSQLTSALSRITPREEQESFSLAFRQGILIFDGGAESDEEEGDREALTDRHHEHFRRVCLALRDEGINLDFSACVFDADEALKVGFQFDGGLKGGDVLVIDLMDGGGWGF